MTEGATNSIGGISLELGLDTSQFDAAVEAAQGKLSALGEGGSYRAAVPLRGGAAGRVDAGASPRIQPAFAVNRDTVHGMSVDINRHFRALTSGDNGVKVPVQLGRSNWGQMRSEIARNIGSVPITVSLAGGGKGQAGMGDMFAGVVAAIRGTSLPEGRAFLRTGLASRGVATPVARRYGGPVHPGQRYYVGEEGPEEVEFTQPAIIKPYRHARRGLRQLVRRPRPAPAPQEWDEPAPRTNPIPFQYPDDYRPKPGYPPYVDRQGSDWTDYRRRGGGVRGYGGKYGSSRPAPSNTYPQHLSQLWGDPGAADPGYLYHGASYMDSIRGRLHSDRGTGISPRGRAGDPHSYWATSRMVGPLFAIPGGYGSGSGSDVGLVRAREASQFEESWPGSRPGSAAAEERRTSSRVPRRDLQYWGDDNNWHRFRKGRRRMTGGPAEGRLSPLEIPEPDDVAYPGGYNPNTGSVPLSDNDKLYWVASSQARRDAIREHSGVPGTIGNRMLQEMLGATRTENRLFRGLHVPAGDPMLESSGREILLPISSFDSNRNAALLYGRNQRSQLGLSDERARERALRHAFEQDPDTGLIPLLLSVEKGARSAHIGRFGGQLDEHALAGLFRVEKDFRMQEGVRSWYGAEAYKGSLRQLVLKQIGLLDPQDPKNILPMRRMAGGPVKRLPGPDLNLDSSIWSERTQANIHRLSVDDLYGLISPRMKAVAKRKGYGYHEDYLATIRESLLAEGQRHPIDIRMAHDGEWDEHPTIWDGHHRIIASRGDPRIKALYATISGNTRYGDPFLTPKDIGLKARRAQGGKARRGGLPRGYRMEFWGRTGEEGHYLGAGFPTAPWSPEAERNIGWGTMLPTISNFGQLKRPVMPPQGRPDWPGAFTAVTRNRAGTIVGLAPFDTSKDRETGRVLLTPRSTWVDPRHRKKGIANAMYVRAEHWSGGTIQPDWSQTDEGKALWQQKDRPFGKGIPWPRGRDIETRRPVTSVNEQGQTVLHLDLNNAQWHSSPLPRRQLGGPTRRDRLIASHNYRPEWWDLETEEHPGINRHSPTIIGTAQRMHRLSPKVFGGVGIGVRALPNSMNRSGAAAHWSEPEWAMFLDPDYLLDASPRDVRETMLHEYGHTMQSYLEQSSDRKLRGSARDFELLSLKGGPISNYPAERFEDVFEAMRKIHSPMFSAEYAMQAALRENFAETFASLGQPALGREPKLRLTSLTTLHRQMQNQRGPSHWFPEGVGNAMNGQPGYIDLKPVMLDRFGEYKYREPGNDYDTALGVWNRKRPFGEREIELQREMKKILRMIPRQHGGAVRAQLGRAPAGSTELARFPQAMMEERLDRVASEITPQEAASLRLWYPMARQHFLDNADRPARLRRGFAGPRQNDEWIKRSLTAGAVLSPQMLYGPNVIWHAASHEQYRRDPQGASLPTHDLAVQLRHVAPWFTAGVPGALPKNVEKAMRALRTPDVAELDELVGKNPKVPHFRTNLLPQHLGGSLDVATLDAIAAQAATVPWEKRTTWDKELLSARQAITRRILANEGLLDAKGQPIVKPFDPTNRPVFSTALKAVTPGVMRRGDIAQRAEQLGITIPSYYTDAPSAGVFEEAMQSAYQNVYEAHRSRLGLEHVAEMQSSIWGKWRGGMFAAGGPVRGRMAGGPVSGYRLERDKDRVNTLSLRAFLDDGSAMHGNDVGVYDFRYLGDDALEPSFAQTSGLHRRKGLATWAYTEAERMTGRTLVKPPRHSPLAAKLWAQPDRPFGNRMAGGPVFPAVEPDRFHAAISAAAQHVLPSGRKVGETVYVYPPDEYADMRTFLHRSGQAGYAIKPDGDFVSVFSLQKGLGKSAVRSAIQRGATKLDAFDESGFLPGLYGRFGFREVGRDPWNPEYAPPEWHGGTPDVVYMRRMAKAERAIADRQLKLRARAKPGGLRMAGGRVKSEATMIRELQLRDHSSGGHADRPNPFCEACDLIATHERMGRPFGDNYQPYIPKYLQRKKRAARGTYTGRVNRDIVGKPITYWTDPGIGDRTFAPGPKQSNPWLEFMRYPRDPRRSDDAAAPLLRPDARLIAPDTAYEPNVTGEQMEHVLKMYSMLRGEKQIRRNAAGGRAKRAFLGALVPFLGGLMGVGGGGTAGMLGMGLNLAAGTAFGAMAGGNQMKAGGEAPHGLYIVNEVGKEGFVTSTDANRGLIPPHVMAQIPKARDGAKTGMIDKPAWSMFAPERDGWIIPAHLVKDVPALVGARPAATGTQPPAGPPPPPRRPRQKQPPRASSLGDPIMDAIASAARNRPGETMAAAYDPTVAEELNRARAQQQALISMGQTGAAGAIPARSSTRAMAGTIGIRTIGGGQQHALNIAALRVAEDEYEQVMRATEAPVASGPGIRATLKASQERLADLPGEKTQAQTRQREALRDIKRATPGRKVADIEAAVKAGTATPLEKEYVAQRAVVRQATKDFKLLSATVGQLEKDEKVVSAAEQKRAKVSEEYLAAAKKAQATPIDVARGMIGGAAAMQAYVAVSQAGQLAMQEIIKAGAPVVDSLMGFTAANTRATKMIGQRIVESGGNVEKAFAEIAMSAGIGAQGMGFLKETLEASSTAKAGQQVAAQGVDLWRGSAGMGAPTGLYGGYGGLFGGSFAADLLGGAAGLAETVSGNFKAMNAQITPARYKTQTVPLSANPSAQEMADYPWKMIAGGMNPDAGWTQETIVENPLTAEQKEANAKAVKAMDNYAADLTDAQKRGATAYGEAEAAFKTVATGVGPAAEKMKADFIAAAEATGDQAAIDAAKNMARAGYVMSNAAGDVITGSEAFQKAWKQLAKGMTITPIETYMAQQAQAFRAQREAAAAQTSYALKTRIEAQTGEQLAAQPFLAAKTGVLPTEGRANLGERGGKIRGLIADVDKLQRELTREGEAAVKAQATWIDQQAAIDPAMNKMAASMKLVSDSGKPITTAADAYTYLMAKVTASGKAIAKYQTQIADLQLNVAAKSYANNLRLANRAVSDALGLAGRAGGRNNLGAVQREQTMLGFGLQQKQINFSVALAGFQAPGLTSEERAARQEQAKIEAAYAQRQLDLSKRSFNIEAGRGVVDTQQARSVMKFEWEAQREIAAVSKAIAAEQAKQAKTLSKAGQFVAHAEGTFGAGLNVATSYVSVFGSSIGQATTKLRAALEMRAVNPQTGKPLSPHRRPATGMLGSFATPMTATFGEAGTETVAILRNPRVATIGMGGGGGGISSTSFTLNLTVQGDVKDEATVAKITRAVEDMFNRKAARLGMRTFVSGAG